MNRPDEVRHGKTGANGLLPWQKRQNPLGHDTPPELVRRWVDAAELQVGDEMVIERRGSVVTAAPSSAGFGTGRVLFQLDGLHDMELEADDQVCIHRLRRSSVR